MAEANRQLAGWMKLHMEKRHLSQNKLAKATGISLTTINRYCDPEDDHEPRMGNVMALSRFFGEKAPLELPGDATPGMAEDGVSPILQDQDDEDWNGNITEWTVKDASMQVMGYLPGDTVKADARITPQDGDVVVCNLYTMDGTKARTALRVFKAPSYLMPATTDAKTLEIHEVGKTAAIFGVIFEMRRTRASRQQPATFRHTPIGKTMFHMKHFWFGVFHIWNGAIDYIWNDLHHHPH